MSSTHLITDTLFLNRLQDVTGASTPNLFYLAFINASNIGSLGGSGTFFIANHQLAKGGPEEANEALEISAETKCVVSAKLLKIAPLEMLWFTFFLPTLFLAFGSIAIRLHLKSLPQHFIYAHILYFSMLSLFSITFFRAPYKGVAQAFREYKKEQGEQGIDVNKDGMQKPNPNYHNAKKEFLPKRSQLIGEVVLFAFKTSLFSLFFIMGGLSASKIMTLKQLGRYTFVVMTGYYLLTYLARSCVTFLRLKEQRDYDSYYLKTRAIFQPMPHLWYND